MKKGIGYGLIRLNIAIFTFIILLTSFLLLVDASPYTDQRYDNNSKLMAVSSISDQSVLDELGQDWEDYVNPDGSHTRKIYLGSRNFWNGSGYEPIDTTINEEGGSFKVEKGVYKVQWDNSRTFILRKDNYFIKYHGKEISSGKSKQILGSIKDVKGKKERNKLRFKDIYPDTDLEYIYYPDLLKENIILNKAPEIAQNKGDTLDFSGDIEYSEGLEIWANGARQSASFSTNGAIEFRTEDKIEFILPPPIIEDAAGSTVRGEYDLINENGRTSLTVKVPYGWLIGSSRTYPVTIDPSVKIIRDIADTFVNGQYPDENYGTQDYLEVKSHKYLYYDNRNERIFLMFPLKSSLPSTSAITSAKLWMYSYSYSSGRTIDLFYLNDNSWGEYDITWNTQPSYPYYHTKISSASSASGWVGWSITDMVKSKWYSDMSLMLKDSAEDSYFSMSQKYHSWEYRYAPNVDPYLEVNYYFNDCLNNGDASDDIRIPSELNPPTTCSGYVDSDDVNDYYKFYAAAGSKIDVSMSPLQGSNFNLELYDPNKYWITGSYNGGSYPDSISYTASTPGDWHIRVYHSSGSGTYTLTLSVSSPPQPPVISSLTHPDQNRWYNNNNPTFTWTVPSSSSGIAGYSFAFDQSSSTVPDDYIDYTGNSKIYTGISNGDWYFHIKAKDNAGNWGQAAHYRVRIDTILPSVSISSPSDYTTFITSTVPVTWSGTDTLAGINYYNVQLDSSGWITTAQTGHTFTNVAWGNHRIHVKAVDKAGNSATTYVNIIVLLPDLYISSEDITFEKPGGN